MGLGNLNQQSTTTGTSSNTAPATHQQRQTTSPPQQTEVVPVVWTPRNHSINEHDCSLSTNSKMESATQLTERSEQEEEETTIHSSLHHDDEDDNTTIDSAMVHQHHPFLPHDGTGTGASALDMPSTTMTPMYGYTTSPFSDETVQHGNSVNGNNGGDSISGVMINSTQQLHASNAHQQHYHQLGTPSTTSTAPSTADDGSMTGYNVYHRRVPSWEGLPQSHSHQYQAVDPSSLALLEQQHSNPWGVPSHSSQHHQHQRGMYQQQQQRVASFRDQQGFPPMAPSSSTMSQHHSRGSGGARWPSVATGNASSTAPQRYADVAVPFSANDAQGHVRAYNPRQSAIHTPPRARGATSRPVNPTVERFPNSPHSRSTPPPTTTPNGSSVSTPTPSAASGARASSEVLKTLLRKKACLYEPDTSRAVALITWLVGRHLALENGFFSRQQLQAGVHACVASKITAGVITRTKVNRCMQIILNSCFHYIIPRPDGTEENGNTFRDKFGRQVTDDSFLLEMLPVPWNDMTVEKDDVLQASLAETASKSPLPSPHHSPMLGSSNVKDSDSVRGTTKAHSDDLSGDDSKRAVLLCFNENVRCAQDVFRCHNEFIRDTAHATNLQLGSMDWIVFFGKEAASTPHLWGNVGIPVPRQEGKDRGHTDALGVMTTSEAANFRTSWCAKRYDHNHELCGFAHSEVNGGWLRRNPILNEYKDEMCPSVSKLSRERSSDKVLILNECPHGKKCSFAHSMEELVYHPRRYKSRICQSVNKSGGCRMSDVCSHFHPIDTYRFPKKSDGRSPRHSRQSQQASSHKTSSTNVPAGAPILYTSPAPLSSFDQQIVTPGLRNLYRRQCALTRALLRSQVQRCHYTHFGDDAGIFPEKGQATQGAQEMAFSAATVIAPPASAAK